MLRKSQVFFVLGVCVVSIPAAAEELTEPSMSEDQQSGWEDTGELTEPSTSEDEPSAWEDTGELAEPSTSEDEPSAPEDTGTPAGQGATPAAGTTGPTEPPPADTPPSTEEKPGGLLEDWHVEVTGYFRAPMALGISSRPSPNDMEGPEDMQVSYGPNRTVDASYYSFAYTRLQEQDWVELSIHAKKKHVDAVVGWLGYWLAAVGFRNPDAAWVPGTAYLTLDTDLELDPGFKPNVALTVGAWWPKFGYFAKYDTFTLGQFRQLGEQLKFTAPLNPDLTLVIVQGFGTGRDGSFVYQINPPIYGAKVGLDLVHYENIQVTYKKYLDIGLHYNNEWTDDPNLFQQATADKNFQDALEAHLSVVGVELGLRAPYAGRLWISPSYITVKNGWALGANGGTEVMHSLGGVGIASNYMAWSNSPADSTGSGSMYNLGFLYENTLSGVQNKAPGSVKPEVTLNVFGLFTEARRDLPTGTVIELDGVKQFKWGADVTVQPLNWLACMLRFDEVNYDLDNPGYIFSAITPRLVISSHFLSGESIYIQYSRYIYGDNMVLVGTWPWGTPLVAGSDILQGGPYTGTKPDEDVVKLQATVAF